MHTDFSILGIVNISEAATIIPQRVENKNYIVDGKKFFQSGHFAEAVLVWENNALVMQREKNIPYHSLILSYLSLAYQELGDINQATKAINQALALLKKVSNKFIQAQVLNNQGQLLLNQGKLENALETWKKAEKIYRELGDKTGEIGTQVNQSLALQGLGMYRRAHTILLSLVTSLEKQSDSQLQIVQLINLGNVFRLTGDFTNAEKTLTSALHLGQKLHLDKYIQQALLNLGNLAFSQQKFSQALSYYQQATFIDNNVKLSAQVQQLEILIELEQENQAKKILSQIQNQLEVQPLSQTKVYAEIEIAKSSAKIGNIRESAKILAIAAKQAEKLGNPRAESYALGYLGNLYEKNQRWEDAKHLTLKAIKLSNAIAAPEVTYQWEWQMGRLLRDTGDITNAINHYSHALNILQYSLRQDLAVVSKDLQFSFRNNVEPIYRQFVDLLLTKSQDISPEIKQTIKPGIKQTIKPEINQENILKARETIESLRVAEIANFFRQACLDNLQRNIETIDTNAAVIYPIILKDLSPNKSNRIEVILSLPGQPLEHYTTYLGKQDIETALSQMLQSLRRTSFKKERLAIAQKIYSWLLEPAIPQLNRYKIKTLVFVLNGSLSNIPIAALHDGNQYLIENYQIAISPSLQLFNPLPLKRKGLSLLLAGLTQENEKFSALPGVKQEIYQIDKLVNQLYPGRSQTFLDQKFTTKTLKNRVLRQPFSIIHLATHGRFSSDPENNFILTADGKLNINILDKLLIQRQLTDSPPIELLVLSACQTAKGDDRATLGLAGVAVRSGARTTLASLWTVNDQSTAVFMIKFYQELLNSEVTKAEALRQAQLYLLKQSKYEHPYFWAPFILVGSWL
ncbi:MAG: CHAT domain-containing protein [Cyanobacteria bacterium P01_A01_bin.45]